MIVVDLDGTLADDRHRQPFLQQRPKRWDEYFEGCDRDTPIEPVIQIVRALFDDGHQVEIWTGRSERVRRKTMEWLYRYDVPYSYLRMRPGKDYRRDTILKGGWLETCASKPELVIDDRPQMVEFWREQGILCLQPLLPPQQ